MKASEMIAELQELIAEHGDLNLVKLREDGEQIPLDDLGYCPYFALDDSEVVCEMVEPNSQKDKQLDQKIASGDFEEVSRDQIADCRVYRVIQKKNRTGVIVVG